MKEGPAKQVIQDISHSSGSYEEAIECLRKRYDRPRIIHKTHVKALVEAPKKTGSGKELRQLHDVESSRALIKNDQGRYVRGIPFHIHRNEARSGVQIRVATTYAREEGQPIHRRASGVY